MRRNLMWKTMLLLAVSGCSAEAALSRLEAISMIESGNNDRAIGGAGEISRYQIKPFVWRRYSNSHAYTDPRVAGWVAEKHLHYLETVFRAKAGREATDFDRYVLWNGGISYYARIGFSSRGV